MDCMMGMECGVGMMLGMLLFLVLLLALVGWGFYRVFRSSRSGPRRDETPPRETPMEILQRRYAEGEISADEYEERKRNLTE